MFDLPILQPEEEQTTTTTTTTTTVVEQPKPTAFKPDRFTAEALEYDGGIGGSIKALFKRAEWGNLLSAAVGMSIGYFAHLGSMTFTASLLASAVFLYASRRR